MGGPKGAVIIGYTMFVNLRSHFRRKQEIAYRIQIRVQISVTFVLRLHTVDAMDSSRFRGTLLYETEVRIEKYVLI